ncbi:MAG: hypothetical protein HY562_09555 [Ignavibacteriales bacterium]|nr:hypothetical protein [Ignavibacteriales bacterium]
MIAFIHSLYNPLHEIPEADLFLAFKAFVGEVAKAQLARIYSECDPEGAKILRNVKDALKRSRTLVLVDELQGLSIRTANRESLLHRRQFPSDQLERELFYQLRHPTNIPTLLRSLEKILSGQSSYRRSIPLIDVVQILKKYFVHFSDYSADEPISSDALRSLSEGDLQLLCGESLKAVQQKIVTTYLLTGKVTREEAVGLSEALGAILKDWIEHKEVHDSFAKRAIQALGISLEQYEDRWRTKVEYLAKIARERLAVGIQENL